jgi:putative SOS response-associated peptidase YedK
MCGRFTLRTPTPVLIETFRISHVSDDANDLLPRYNVAPTQQVAVVRSDDAARRELMNMRWGLVPFWAKDVAIGNRMINARCETVADKPAFRAAFRQRRCLVVADGYYEWKKIGSKKQPYWIRMEDERPFGMAGLWETWREPQDTDDRQRTQPLLSCTVITTDANDLTRDLHDRMPVLLEPDAWDLWLDATVEEVDAVQALLRPLESDAMKIEPVSTFVNNARHEGPECVAVQRELF